VRLASGRVVVLALVAIVGLDRQNLAPLVHIDPSAALTVAMVVIAPDDHSAVGIGNRAEAVISSPTCIIVGFPQTRRDGATLWLRQR
jgi:hypothetical protein